MQVAVQIEFKADRKEPLGELVRRAAALFESSGLHFKSKQPLAMARAVSETRLRSNARSRSTHISRPSSATMHHCSPAVPSEFPIRYLSAGYSRPHSSPVVAPQSR